MGASASVLKPVRFSTRKRERMKGVFQMKKNRVAKAMAFFLLAGILTVLKISVAEAAYLSSVSDLKQTNAAKNAVTVSWSPVEEATEYLVYYREIGASDYTYSGKTSNTTYALAGLKDGTKYYVQVKASDGTKESIGRTLYDVVTLPDKVDGLRQKGWYYFIHSLEIEWEKKSGVSGCELSLCNSKGKTVQKKNVAYGSSTSFSDVKDSVYTIQARLYTVFNGQKHYSETGSIHCIPQARISKIKISGKKLSLAWKKIDGATGYKVYISTKKDKGYKLVKSLKKKSVKCTITKIKGKKINPKKTYYVYVKTICKKGTSGALYYWSTKNGKFGYLPM